MPWHMQVFSIGILRNNRRVSDVLIYCDHKPRLHAVLPWQGGQGGCWLTLDCCLYWFVHINLQIFTNTKTIMGKQVPVNSILIILFCWVSSLSHYLLWNMKTYLLSIYPYFSDFSTDSHLSWVHRRKDRVSNFLDCRMFSPLIHWLF